MKPLTYVFVTGGRDYPDRARVWAALDTLAFLYGDLCVIQGACRGADLMAEAWAKDRQHDYVGCPAKWDRDGKKAGYDRNKEMMRRYFKKDALNVLINFEGGNGTRHMVYKVMWNYKHLPNVIMWHVDGEWWK